MCGRYTLHSKKAAIEQALGADFADAIEPDYNIGPGRAVAGLRWQRNTGTVAGMMHWGLRTSRNFIINARLETADQIHRFREDWAEHRCLLPANGFYEWLRTGDRKEAYYFRKADEPLVAFAGICFAVPEVPSGTCCVILTTTANAGVEAIHNRMPVTLPFALRDDWLGGSLGKQDLADLAAQTEWSGHPVSPRVNSVRNNSSDLIIETKHQPDPQMHLL